MIRESVSARIPQQSRALLRPGMEAENGVAVFLEESHSASSRLMKCGLWPQEKRKYEEQRMGNRRNTDCGTASV